MSQHLGYHDHKTYLPSTSKSFKQFHHRCEHQDRRVWRADAERDFNKERLSSTQQAKAVALTVSTAAVGLHHANHSLYLQELIDLDTPKSKNRERR